MAIKSGQILHDAHGFVIDRIQTGGAGQVTIPEEKVYELGNFQTVATTRDIPDLTFDLESLDVSTEIESLILFRDPTTAVDGDEFDFGDAVPMDIISPFKSDNNQYNIIRGVIVPYLTLESATYRFGLTANATESFSFRGDAIYYTPGTPYYEEYTHDGTTDTYALAHAAIPYVESGDTLHVLALDRVNADGTYGRLFYGQDYTDTTTNFTLVDPTDIPSGTVLRAVYGSTVSATYPQTVHQGVSVKPAAVRGKDIDVYVGSGPVRTFAGSTTNADATLTGTGFSAADVGARVSGTGIDPGTTIASYTDATHVELSAPATATGTPTITLTPAVSRWTSVQSFEVTRRVNLDSDDEFGNPHHVSQDYDTADVTGSVTVRPRDPDDLFDKINQVANVASNQVVGVLSSVGLPVELRINDPDTGDLLKTLYVPDARFQTPGIQGRVQSKTEVTFNFTSDGGSLLVYKGAR